MKEFWKHNIISQVHLELSSHCNAACPMCPRYYGGSELVKPDIVLDQVTLEKFKSWFTEDFIQRTNGWMFCGTVGDPMMAKDALKIIEYIYSINPQVITQINTNGGMRNPKDWEFLGHLSKTYDKRIKVIFSIDGLEDTNHLYRRKVDWKKLMANVSAYITAGGRAEWDFLIFKHNEHQLDEAEKIATNMGFSRFVPKKALGFEFEGKLKKVAALDREGKFQYWLEAPADIKNRNSDATEEISDPFDFIEPEVIKFYKKVVIDPHQKLIDNWDGKTFQNTNIRYEELDKKGIKCKSETWGGLREIYINASGLVLPCCYIGTHINTNTDFAEIVQVQRKLQDYGKDLFSLEKYSLKEILENNHLNKLYANSWDKTGNDRLIICASTCGENSPLDKLWEHEKNTKPNRSNYHLFADNER